MHAKQTHSQKPALSSLNLVLVAGAISSMALINLALQSQAYGQANLADLLTSSLIVCLCCAYLWAYHVKHELELHLPSVLAFALFFRAIGVATFPILEDDFYRYLWDGLLTIEKGTPYGISPASFFGHQEFGGLSEQRFSDILGGINYPDVPTVYGPTSQWVFALCYWLSPGELWPLKLILMICDIVMIAALLKLASPLAVMLYAWSPLILKEFVVSAHPDLMGASLMVLALLAYKNKHDFAVGSLLALSAGVKIFALVVLPFLFLYRWRSWLAFMATGILIALPFGVTAAWFPEGLKVMGSNWLFNAPLYELMSAKISIPVIKTVLLSLFLIGGAFYGLSWIRQHLMQSRLDARPIPRADLLFAALFLCAPVFNPWYLVWLLPFAVLRPSLWAWVASFSLLLSYASGINLSATHIQAYQLPNWVLVLEFGLIAAALLLSTWLKRMLSNASVC